MCCMLNLIGMFGGKALKARLPCLLNIPIVSCLESSFFYQSLVNIAVCSYGAHKVPVIYFSVGILRARKRFRLQTIFSLLTILAQ